MKRSLNLVKMQVDAAARWPCSLLCLKNSLNRRVDCNDREIEIEGYQFGIGEGDYSSGEVHFGEFEHDRRIGTSAPAG